MDLSFYIFIYSQVRKLEQCFALLISVLIPQHLAVIPPCNIAK